MEKYNIFTENPEEEIWNHLLQYTYKSKIEKYFEAKNMKFNEEIFDEIKCSILQAKEYYRLSKDADVSVKPLLIYYGTINLLTACSLLISGEKIIINNHGMKIDESDVDGSLGSWSIKFNNITDGGIHVFLKSITEGKVECVESVWKLNELLMSIPEINEIEHLCYSNSIPYCLPINEICMDNETIETIDVNQYTIEQIMDFLSEVDEFQKNYINPKYQNNIVILKHKYLAKDISCETISGRKYLLRSHIKNEKKVLLPQWAYYTISLFALSSLCRYNPKTWNKFVTYDEFNEKLLVSKFLNLCIRILPNFCLNIIDNKTYQFTNKKYEPINKTTTIDKAKIEEIVNAQLRGVNNGR